jgi:hypothetical protein
MSDKSLPMTFDPASFESQTTNDESSTSLIPIPAGEYNAQIEDYKFTQGTSKKSGDTFTSMNITYRLLDDNGEIAQRIGREPKIQQSYFIETTPQGGFDFAKGKNVWLGKIREAVGMNIPGQTFTFALLKGQVLRVNVIEDPQKDDPTTIYNRVKSVGRVH